MSGRRSPPLPQRPCLPSHSGARWPPTRFSPRWSQRRVEGRLPKPSLTPTQRLQCRAPPQEPSVLRGERRWEQGQERGLGRSGAPCGSRSLYHLSLTLWGGNVPVLPVPQPGHSRNPQSPPRPAQPGSSQPPPLAAAPTAPGHRADFVNQTAEQPSPALTAPQPCSRVPLQFPECNSVEKRLYAVSTKLFICYIHIYTINLFIAI